MASAQSKHGRALVLACGAAVGVAQAAMAQPYTVNTFGASLLGNLLTGSQVNNDFIDVDGDGNATNINGLPDNLTQSLSAITPSAGFVPSNYFVHQYRSVGSVNGLQELIDWGSQANLAGDTNGNGTVEASERFAGLRAAETGVNGATCPGMRQDAANPATVNRVNYISSGATTGAWFNTANPGSIPFRSSTDGTYTVQAWSVSGTASTGGVQNDIAPIDVPVYWGVTAPGSASWSKRAGQAGYGLNARNSKNAQGGAAGANFGNQLVTLPTGFSLYNGVPASATSKTIFSTEIAWAPILPYANYGTGIVSLKYTELQHLFVTGRLPSGENLMVISRDSGSGTHNGIMNSLGIDPSWGAGENIGTLNSAASAQTLGSGFIPGNKATSGSLDNTLRNVRLGVGYGGGERFANNSIYQFAEIIGVENNLGGRTGTPNVRPTITNILNNGLIGEANPTPGESAYTSDGWRIGGKAVFATLGDPRRVPAVDGGYGFDVNDPSPAPATPAMANAHAAEWLNNISRSISVYDRLVSPTPPATADFSPGEFVGTFVFPLSGVDRVPDTNAGGLTFVTSPTYNDNTRQYLEFTAANPYRSIASAFRYNTYGASDTTLNGRVPSRTPAGIYSDNADASNNLFGLPPVSAVNYRLQDNTFDNGGDVSAAMEARNRIAGDFNGDNLRDINDATDMIKAWRQRNDQTFTWVAPNGYGLDNLPGTGDDTPGAKASIELLGDFTGDGNFGRAWNGTAWVANRMDVRYWADGLGKAVSGPRAGKIDRKAAFTAVDAASLAVLGTNNFFGTTKAHGTYAAGDSRGDIANSAGQTTPGFLPIGADGNGDATTANDNRIDAFDVDYISRQINTAADRQVNWETNLSEASLADFSADVNGDLVIDCNDVNEIVTVILGTTIGDINLDGIADAADAMIATANLGLANAVWSMGDVDCDGVVTAADVNLITGGGGLICDTIDFNGDGLFPDTGDIDDFLSVFSGGPCSNDPNCGDVDFNNDGLFPDTTDIDSLLSVFSGGPCL